MKVKLVLDVDRSEREAIAEHLGIRTAEVTHAVIRREVKTAWNGHIEDLGTPVADYEEEDW